jgi:hypothetical protein
MAMAMTMTSILTLRELEELRSNFPLIKNMEYHVAMHDIVENAKKGLKLEEIREHFIKIITENPEKNYISYSFCLNLEPLFRNPPLEIWLNCMPARLSKYDTYYPEYHSAGMRRIILRKENHVYFKPFEEYIYTTDPDIQGLRQMIQEAFPDASLHPFFFAHPGNTGSHLDISICYNLSKTLEGLETYTHVWRGENDRAGDCARWLKK